MSNGTLTLAPQGVDAIPVIDEAHVMARLDALVAEHGLPDGRRQYIPDLWADDPVWRERRGLMRVLVVTVPTRGDVACWAAVLGAKAETDHLIYEYEDGRWCAIWRESAHVERWLGDVELSIRHTEDRWIARPGGER